MGEASGGGKILKILKIIGVALALLIVAILAWGMYDGDDMLSHIPAEGEFGGAIRLHGFNQSWKGLKGTRLVKLVLRKNDLPEDITEREIFLGWTTDDIISAFGKDLLYIRQGGEEIFVLKIGALTKIAEPFSSRSARVETRTLEGVPIKVLLDGDGEEEFFYKRLGRTILFSESAEALVNVCSTRSQDGKVRAILAATRKKEFAGYFSDGKEFADFLARIDVMESSEERFLAELSDVTAKGTFDRQIRGNVSAVMSAHLAEEYPFLARWKVSPFENLSFIPRDYLASVSFDSGMPLIDTFRLLKANSEFAHDLETVVGDYLSDIEETFRQSVKDEASINLCSLRRKSDKVYPVVSAVVEGNLEEFIKLFDFFLAMSNGATTLRKKNFGGKDIYYLERKDTDGFSYCPANGKSLFANRPDEIESMLKAVEEKKTLGALKDVQNLHRTGNLLAYLNCSTLEGNLDLIVKYLRQQGVPLSEDEEELFAQIEEVVSTLAFVAANARVEESTFACEYALDLR
jgi:hypothetical protein